MIDKNIISKLIPIANSCIASAGIVNEDTISSIYNGKVAALSVSIAMSGLLPTLAMYRRSTKENTVSETQKILGIISNIIEHNDSPYKGKYKNNNVAINDNSGKKLNCYAISNNPDSLREAIIHCAVALKLVIRTYKLKIE